MEGCESYLRWSQCFIAISIWCDPFYGLCFSGWCLLNYILFKYTSFFRLALSHNPIIKSLFVILNSLFKDTHCTMPMTSNILKYSNLTKAFKRVWRKKYFDFISKTHQHSLLQQQFSLCTGCDQLTCCCWSEVYCTTEFNNIIHWPCTDDTVFILNNLKLVYR